jgi:DNA-binding response OmpR family regulator
MPAAMQEAAPEARVLVVDDEDNIVELLSVSLKFQGFEVHTATNGASALDLAREVKPDAVILDVMMPGMDGFGVLRRLRADGIDAPALFLTARDSLQDKIAGLTLGGDDYVTKPFSLEEVVARLRVILRRTGKGITENNNARLTFADIPRSMEGRRASLVVAHRVHPAALFRDQRGHRVEQTEDSGPRVALRLWRRCQRGRVLCVLSASQDRHR